MLVDDQRRVCWHPDWHTLSRRHVYAGSRRLGARVWPSKSYASCCACRSVKTCPPLSAYRRHARRRRTRTDTPRIAMSIWLLLADGRRRALQSCRRIWTGVFSASSCECPPRCSAHSLIVPQSSLSSRRRRRSVVHSLRNESIVTVFMHRSCGDREPTKHIHKFVIISKRFLGC